MKNLSLFTLVALMVCGCSEGGNEIDKQKSKKKILSNLVKTNYLLILAEKSNPFMFIAAVIGR